MIANDRSLQRQSVKGALLSRLRASKRSMFARHDVPAERLSACISLCDQGLVSLTNFLTCVMVGRFCGTFALGVYTLAWTAMTVITGVFATLITTPYTVLGPQLSAERRHQYLVSSLIHQLVLSLLLGALVAGFALARGAAGIAPTALTNVANVTAGALIFTSLREFIRNVSFADLKMQTALCLDCATCATQVAGMLVLIYRGGLSTPGALLTLGIASAVSTALWLTRTVPSVRWMPSIWMADLKRNWAFGRWVLGSGLMWQCAGYVFPWMLAAFHGTATTGAWAACTGIVAFGNPLLLGLSNYMMPCISTIYASSGSRAMSRYVNRCGLVLFAIFLPLVIASSAFGDRIVTAVYGNGFHGSSAILTILAMNTLMITVGRPYAQGLFSLNLAKTDTVINVIWVTLLFAIGVPAVRTYSTFGAAATMLTSSGVAITVKYLVFRKWINASRPPTRTMDVRTPAICLD